MEVVFLAPKGIDICPDECIIWCNAILLICWEKIALSLLHLVAVLRNIVSTTSILTLASFAIALVTRLVGDAFYTGISFICQVWHYM